MAVNITRVNTTDETASAPATQQRDEPEIVETTGTSLERKRKYDAPSPPPRSVGASGERDRDAYARTRRHHALALAPVTGASSLAESSQNAIVRQLQKMHSSGTTLTPTSPVTSLNMTPSYLATAPDTSPLRRHAGWSRQPPAEQIRKAGDKQIGGGTPPRPRTAELTARGRQIRGGTSPRPHTSEPTARGPYFEEQQDQHCWVHAINMVMGRKHMDVGKTLTDIKRIVQADDKLRATHRDKPLYHETKGFYATDIFRDYAEGTHGIYITKIGPVDKDTGEITAEIHRGQNITQVIQQQGGAGIVMIDHRHAAAVIAHGDKWYHMDAEKGGPRVIRTRNPRWRLPEDYRKATAYLVSEDTVYRDAHDKAIGNRDRLAPAITLGGEEEDMEDDAPLAPPKRKRGRGNRTDRTNNLTRAPRSTERTTPQPASTSTHTEHTDAPTRTTDGDKCNDEPAAQRPKKTPVARPDTVTWDKVIDTILKGNAKAKQLMGWKYTYVVRQMGKMLQGLEKGDKAKRKYAVGTV